MAMIARFEGFEFIEIMGEWECPNRKKQRRYITVDTATRIISTLLFHRTGIKFLRSEKVKAFSIATQVANRIDYEALL